MIISVYDPYSYVDKFNTPSRKAAGAKLSGNTVFVSEKNFKKYGNKVNYWVFSNDYKKKKSKAKKNVTKYVATQSQSLNVRAKANKSSKVLTQLKKGTKVTVTKVSGSWSYITAPTKGWVSTAYLSSTKVVADKPKKVTYKTTVGKHYRLKGKTYLYKNKKLLKEYKEKKPDYEYAVAGYLTVILTQIVRKMLPKDFKNIIGKDNLNDKRFAIIEQAFLYEKDLTLTKLSTMIGLCERQTQRLLKKYYKKSFRELKKLDKEKT